MTSTETLEKILPAYKRYYNINTEDPTQPFDAEAVFNSHNEQYYLVKSAKVADIESNEYVFFKAVERLDTEEFGKLTETAWEKGLKDVNPTFSHKNTDVTLVIVADSIDEDCIHAIKNKKLSQSYFFNLKGYSNFHVVAVEPNLNRVLTNRRGRFLKKMFMQYIQ